MTFMTRSAASTTAPSSARAPAAPRAEPLRLRPGEWVEVRSEAEIRATLDESGTLDALPFMPEMWKFCGRSFRVKTRADRTVIECLGPRRMTDAVHLDLRCDGEAHDRCSRSCLIFWKEAWLRRASSLPVTRPIPKPGTPALPTRRGDQYFCQSTELARATKHLRALDLRQYVDALSGEDVRAIDLFFSLAILARDSVVRPLGGEEWNVVPGPCKQTPSVSLGLRPGERVRVKRLPEIVATLNAKGWNRGMEFSREMVSECGKEHTVLKRVDRVIMDKSARMILMRDTVILEGLAYKDLVRRACPRGEYMFWRECWLERAR